MILTRQNLGEVIFENQDAKLLIQDVVEHTEATLYYYHGVEITVRSALRIWHRAMDAGRAYAGRTVSFPAGCRA